MKYAVFLLSETEIPAISELTGKSQEWLRAGLEAAKLKNTLFVFQVDEIKGTGKGHIYKMEEK